MLGKIYIHSESEERHYESWERNGLFKPLLKKSYKPFSMVMPPPNITGELHTGHALTYTIQDVICRFKRMSGYDVLYQPGFDHAGIATQLIVGKDLEKKGIKLSDISSKDFFEHALRWKEYIEKIISKQQRALGISADWSRSLFTLDKDLSLAVRTAFRKLYEDGLIYKSKRLVNWDPTLLTVVSDLSVMNKEISGKFWYIKYPIVELENKWITVATTRPETIFGDVAIAICPGDSRYQWAIHKNVRVPLIERVIPIIEDNYSDPNKGTGAVRITPAHDFNDFEVGVRHKLESFSIFDKSACLDGEVPDYLKGVSRFDARIKVIEFLKNLNLIENVLEKSYTVPIHERSGVVLEPFLTDQWFVDSQRLAGKAMKAVSSERIKIFPKHYQEIYDHWMREIKPWCVSRQILWGHRIPVWYGPDNKIFVDLSEEKAHNQAKNFYGSDIQLKQDSDVLDTWFSSSIWPFSTLGWPQREDDLRRYYPTTTLVTGSDILLFWVSRMIMMSLYLLKKIPFKEVYLHTLIKDKVGRKMSKTRGNVSNPLEMIKLYGCDALRMSLTSLSSQGREIRFSPLLVKEYRNFSTKIWNAARFCEYHGCYFIKNFDQTSVKHPLNKWVIGEIANLSVKVKNELDEYRFDRASSILCRWVRNFFCNWYLEMLKPLLIGVLSEEDKKNQKEARETSSWSLVTICHLLHPFMPFITEEIYQIFSSGKGYLMEKKWPYLGRDISHMIDPLLENDLIWIMKLIRQVRDIRSKFKSFHNISISLRSYSLENDVNRRLKTFEKILKRIACLKRIEYVSNSSLRGKYKESLLSLEEGLEVFQED